MTLKYATGSMFSVLDGPRPERQIVLVHACNAQGIWGGGPTAVATQMRERFPIAYLSYQRGCKLLEVKEEPLPWIVTEHGVGLEPSIASLIVSVGYGDRKDIQRTILDNTHRALELLPTTLDRPADRCVFHSPRFNAGRFRVPWERTEEVLQKVVDEHGLDWTVWDLPTSGR